MSKQPKLKIETRQVIREQDWSEFVTKVYGRTYRLQQQDGCHPRGTMRLDVPEQESSDDYDFENDSLEESLRCSEMGVRLAAWLARDPKKKLEPADEQEDYCLDLWWERNFYPSLQAVANDLHAKGLLPAGSYLINIDW